VAKLYYHPGWHEPCTTGEVLFNLQVWEDLTPTQQAMMQAVVEAEAWREYADFSAHNADSLKVLVEEHGVDVRRFNDDLLNEIGRISGDVVAEVGTSDPLTQQIYNSYMDFRGKALGWAALSEQSYYNARSLPFQYG
jgi:TRAP-type mannitol/chloroaromatic compound transport system substrate-binding protein